MRPLQVTPRHTITELALSPDGRQLGVVQEQQGFRLLDALTGAELARDVSGPDVTEASPTERHSLFASRAAVRLAEVTAGKPFLRFQTGWTRSGNLNRPPAENTTSALHHAAAVYQFGETRHISAHPRRYGQAPPDQFALYDCALTADHRFAVGRLAPSGAWYSVCDLATEIVAIKLSFREWISHNDSVRMVFSPDGTRVVAVTPRTLAVFDLPPAVPLDAPPKSAPLISAAVAGRVTQPQPQPGVPPFAVLPCGRKMIVRGEKSRIELRDLSTGDVQTVWKWGLPRVNALAVAADGLTAAAAGVRGHVVMWDLG